VSHSPTRNRPREVIAEYIEAFYDRQRLHSTWATKLLSKSASNTSKIAHSPRRTVTVTVRKPVTPSNPYYTPGLADDDSALPEVDAITSAIDRGRTAPPPLRFRWRSVGRTARHRRRPAVPFVRLQVPGVVAGRSSLQPASERIRIVVAVQLDVLAGLQGHQPVQDRVVSVAGRQPVQVDERAFGERIPARRHRPLGITSSVSDEDVSERGCLPAQVLFEPDDQPAGQPRELVRVVDAVRRRCRGQVLDVLAEEKVLLAQPADSLSALSTPAREGRMYRSSSAIRATTTSRR